VAPPAGVENVKDTSQIAWNPRLGASPNARRKLPPMMGAYFRQVRELLAADPAPAELHTIRLDTKRVRYTLELFRPCYGPGLEVRIAALQRLQQVLGEVNDCSAAECLIERLVPASSARTRVRTFLRRRAAAKATELRREWHEIFDAPGREHWWIHYLSRNAKISQPGL
jgi:CHAD domain-containing protein